MPEGDRAYLVQSFQNAALIAGWGPAPISNVIVLRVLAMGALQSAQKTSTNTCTSVGDPGNKASAIDVTAHCPGILDFLTACL